MYLYDFLKEIEPLRTQKPPKEIIPSTPDEIVFESFVDRKTAEKHTDKLPAKGDYFQSFVSLSDPTNITFRDVSSHVSYMNKFTLETCKFPVDNDDMLSLAEVKQSCYEATVLLYYLAPVSNYNMNTKVNSFEVFSENDIKEERPIIEYYENNPLNLLIYETQIIFFFAKYVESKFKGEKMANVYENEFISVMKDGMTEYRKHGIYTSDFDSVIYGNPELYGFICQLISLDSAAEEEQRKKETEKKEKKEKISK